MWPFTKPKSISIARINLGRSELMGRAHKDLTGLVVGKLKVLSFAGRSKDEKLQWLCRCECGKTKVIYASKLTATKPTQSCGCAASTDRIKDLTGEVFGKLTVLRLAESRGRRTYYWLCRCECGGDKIIRGSHLKSRATTSCGKCPNRFEHVADGVTTIIWLERRNGESLPCLIDTADYLLVKDHHWSPSRQPHTTYAVSSGGVKVRMHRLLVSCLKRSQNPDHNNLDGLDNRRRNLRVGTRSQDNANRRTKNSELGKYKGVQRQGNRFLAFIKFKRKGIRLGMFDSPHDAARVYNAAAIKYFGEFARTNDIGDTSDVSIGGVWANGPLRGQRVKKEKP
jgi:hypothetical protein